MAAIRQLSDELAYEAEISQCIKVTGYHHWFFLTAMAEALKLEFRAYAVDSGGECLGVIPILYRKRGLVSTVNYLPIGCIGPLICGETLRSGRIPELIRAADPVLRGHRTVLTNWAFSPGLNVNADDLAVRGFEVLESENYVISADKSPDDCLKAMSRVRRQSIRQSESHGVSVTESSAEEIKSWLPQQMEEAYQRQGALPGYTHAEIQYLTDKLAVHPRMLWRTAKSPDGNVLGMTGCVIGDERLWGWVMVGPRVSGISAHTLCYWDLIKWSLERGLAYDLGGVPTEGIRKLKISLGADVETSVNMVRIRPRMAYQTARAVYNRTMTGLTKLRSG
jgi:Acetyltransferase (GNAT) domain